MIIRQYYLLPAAILCLGDVISAQTGAVIRGQLASGQPGVYVSIAPAVVDETVLLSALINGRRANLKSVDGSIHGSVLVPIALSPAGTTGDAYLPLEIPLKTGDCVQILQNRYIGGRGTFLDSQEECVSDPFDFGRLRYYFTAGAVASKNDDDFSQTDLFMSFSLDKNYFLSNRKGWSRVRLNTYFDTRLTALPVAQHGAGGLDSFFGVRKAAALQIGSYLPITTTQWRNHDADYSLFVAPLAKVGFVTPTDTSDISIINPKKFFTFYGMGGRLGHFREFKKADRGTDTSVAPELLSSVDFIVGRFGNFETYRDQTPILRAQHLLPDNYGAPGYVRKRLYRLNVEGTLLIPSTPLIIGFNANIGLGRHHEPGFSLVQDDLQFLFGARFDARRLAQKLSELK